MPLIDSELQTAGTGQGRAGEAEPARAASWQQAMADARPKEPAPGAANAGSMIAAATDPRTGAVDTKALGAAVAQAAGGHMDRASQAYGDIHHALSERSPVEASDFAAATRAAFASGSSALAGASRGASEAGHRLLVDNPILTKRWESTVSPWTGKGGMTDGLQAMLRAHGIEVSPHVNPEPAGGLGRASGVPAARANNVNGSLARDGIAARAQQAGAAVHTEVSTQGGARRVDVRADYPARDPRMTQRIDTESKLGRASDSATLRGQAMRDAADLAENGRLRGLGAGMEKLGKVALPVAIASDAVQLHDAWQQDGGKVGTHTGEAASGIAGAWAGAEGGALLGAELGTAAGPVGTVVGGLAGGVIGGVAGSTLGKDIYKGVASLF